MAEQRTPRRRARKVGDSSERVTRRRAAPRNSSTDTDLDEAYEADVEEEREPAARGSERGTRAEKETVRGELASIMREAALEVLGPSARTITTQAAKYAIRSAPDLARNSIGPRLKETLGPRIEEAGSASALAKETLSKISGARGGLLSKVGIGARQEEPGAGGRARRLPLHDAVDVAVPLETAYDQFTNFEDFPKFLQGVSKVEQQDDAHLVWHEQIWGVRRAWEVEIIDQEPNERIAWKSGEQAIGLVTFHRLSDRLTRIEVIINFRPHGMVARTGSGLRVSRRALKSHLAAFKAFLELGEDELGWDLGVDQAESMDGDTRPRSGKSGRRDGKGAQKRADRKRRIEEPEEEEEYELEDEYEVEEELEPGEDEDALEGGEDEEELEAAEDEEALEDEEEEPEEEPVVRKPAVRRRAPARSRKQTRGRG